MRLKGREGIDKKREDKKRGSGNRCTGAGLEKNLMHIKHRDGQCDHNVLNTGIYMQNGAEEKSKVCQEHAGW